MPAEEEPNVWDVIEIHHYSDMGSYFGYDRIFIAEYILGYDSTDFIEWYFPCN